MPDLPSTYLPVLLGLTLVSASVALACAPSGAGSTRGQTGLGGSAGASGRGVVGTSGADPAAGANGGRSNGGAGGNSPSNEGGAAASGGGGAAGIDTSMVDGPSGEAFDTRAGVLNVHYGEYLPKHDLVYNQPNPEPLYGLTVGNGRVGAMVWSDQGLRVQVANVDASEQTAFSAGLVHLSTSPALDAGFTTFQQRLALYDGVLTTQYDQDRTVTIMGSANSELLGIHVEDRRTAVTSATLDLGLWDVSTLQNSGAAPDLNTWKNVVTFADATGAGISRGQTDANHFGYTLAATVAGAAFTAQTLNGSSVRLTITPTPSYTIWLACATRLNAPSNDSVAQAKALLMQAQATSYAETLSAYQDFWHRFWSRSFVQYSNTPGDADYLENVYYLATYLIASGGYGNYPFHFINGVYRATADNTKWSNAYWYWNQRDIYNSFLASNHADLLDVFNRMYSRNFAALKAFTKTRYGIDGIWVPETMGFNGSADGTVGSDFTKNIYSTGSEAAENMYAQYAYTGAEEYLKNTAYPFMREVVKFYQQKLSFDAGTGKYWMTSSNAHETYWNVPNAITDLAAVRSLFPLAIMISTALGLDADLRAGWQDILANLVAYPSDGRVYLPHQPPIAMTHNGENVAAELIWPYGVTGLGAPDYDVAVNTWRARPAPYGNVWANDAIQAARLGLGDEANQGMKLMLQRYQNYPNGFTNNTNGVFEYLGVHLSAMNESLLQSYADKLRVFPALPKDPSLVTRFTLLAKGGFVVSSEREAGDIKYVGLKSLLGKPVSIENPWGATPVQVRRVSDDSITLSSSNAELRFETEVDAVYVIERAARHLGSYAYSHLTGKVNQDAKYLSDTTFLGIAATPR